MRKLTLLLIISAMLILPASAIEKGMTGTYMTDNGRVKFYCGGRVVGFSGYTSYRQLGENRVKMYKKNGEGRVFDFVISLDKSKIWLSPDNAY